MWLWFASDATLAGSGVYDLSSLDDPEGGCDPLTRRVRQAGDRPATRMLTAEWYYLEPYVDGDGVEVCVVADDESIVGPLKLSEIVDRVRVGRLPDDVMIGRDREHFEYAVCVPEYLRALPVVRERIV